MVGQSLGTMMCGAERVVSVVLLACGMGLRWCMLCIARLSSALLITMTLGRASRDTGCCLNSVSVRGFAGT
eukprot:1504258-Pyramimonas_sp.AAC.1